jgi:hypothetical protein
VKYADKVEEQKLIAGLKTFFPTTRYHFAHSGIFKQTTDRHLMFDGTYRTMPSQKLLRSQLRIHLMKM